MSANEAERVAEHAVHLLALAGNPDLDEILRDVLHSAQALADARWAALGIPDRHGGFDRFLTVGIDEEQADLIGELPRRHGVLGLLLEAGETIRLEDIRQHPRFSYYPRHHPIMRDFLGVPIRHRGEILGNLYLAGSERGRFSDADERLIGALAAYAGVAIANAQTYAQAQELALAEERARLARELHDAVSQDLFALVLEARAAALQAGEDGSRAAIERLGARAQSALRDMRGLVYDLRPKTLESDGLAATLRQHVDALLRSHHVPIGVEIDDRLRVTQDEAFALLRIAQEALHNALRHAPGAPIALQLLTERTGTRLVVTDRGPGFDLARPPRTERHMGLANMRQRAAAVHGTLEVRTAPGEGCTITVTIPAARRMRRRRPAAQTCARA